jgi:hypothetical protein
MCANRAERRPLNYVVNHANVCRAHCNLSTHHVTKPGVIDVNSRHEVFAQGVLGVYCVVKKIRWVHALVVTLHTPTIFLRRTRRGVAGFYTRPI